MNICNLCNKEFKFKNDYMRHINRKTNCVKTDIKCFRCNRIFNLLSDLQKHLNKKKSCNNSEIYTCDQCNKQYITKRNYNNHMKTHASNNSNKLQEINNDINITNNGNHNVNNSTINNNNPIINITINKFGNEDRTYISDERLCEILNQGYQVIPELTRETHFNKNHPENHNVYINNVNKKTLLIYDGERWILSNKNDIINDIILNQEDYVLSKFEDVKNKLSILSSNRMERVINDLNTNDNYIKQLTETISNILYNYKDIPKNTIKNMKK